MPISGLLKGLLSNLYPVGSLVRLESGMLGIVVKSSNENLLRPTVRAVFTVKHGRFVAPHDIDLSIQLGDSIVRHESLHGWGIDPIMYL